MRKRQDLQIWLALVTLLVGAVPAAPQDVAVDLGGYSPACGVDVVRSADGKLTASWPLEAGEKGIVVLDIRPGKPLIERIAIAPDVGEPISLATGISPVFRATAGSRVSPPGRPPEMSPFNSFFDNPASRPHEAHASRLDLKRVRATSEGRRASIAVGDLSMGPFAGEIILTFYTGSRLLRIEAAVSTNEERRAFTYDAGLVGEASSWVRAAWTDTEGRLQRADLGAASAHRPIAVRHRAIVAEGEAGSLACFPPPHQFFFPRDWTDNLSTVWTGRAPGAEGGPVGIGIRQPPRGGGNFVPWFNAPPGTRQRLAAFYVLSRGPAGDALRETLRYTHGDRFPALPGHLVLTTHWHMAIAVASMAEDFRTRSPLPIPSFVKIFKDMGVNLVHLAEFHGDGHQGDPGPLRLPELEAMFAECRRLSDAELLFIPGEEVNTFLGIAEPGKHPGHWMSLFPRPVYWALKRAPGEPFAGEHPKYGRVYRVGSRADMIRLLEEEKGLAWAAHPRIKASSWTPDIFRKEDFYLADTWLGAAWKSMPADLSRPRLGERSLDLLDDMSNWGGRKYLPGEVDVFKIDPAHELYGHMNVNYVRLDRLPRFSEGWQPLLDALRGGRFFVTTGEVLIRAFSVGGKASGETLDLPPDGKVELRTALEWTFPLEFADVISGDGEKVYRERIPLADTQAFGSRALTLDLDLKGRRWVRFEVWDAAANGAFTQPVWTRP